MQSPDLLNAVTSSSVSRLIPTTIAPHAGNLAKEMTPASQINLHAISVQVSLKNSKLRLSTDVGMSGSRGHWIKICISHKPSGAPMGKVPLQVLKELEHQARQNLSTINFTDTFAKTASCNTVMEKCQHSIKATFKRVKSQIQNGANPERAVRHGYDNTCDYFEIMNKRILIQKRALACLSKSVAHILQKEPYTMGNTGLLRCEAEMTLLQPHLGDSRRQELRNSPFWPTPLFSSQLVKDGEDFLLKKGTPKDSQGFGPYQNLSWSPTQ